MVIGVSAWYPDTIAVAATVWTNLQCYGDGDKVVLCEQTFKYKTRRSLDEIPQMLIALITSHCNYIRIFTLIYCVIIFSNYTHMFKINYTGI